jgi:hypothetical protein
MPSQHFYMVTPGARLDVGPTGGLYETAMAGEDEAIAAKSDADAQVAALEPDGAVAAKRAIQRMKRSLKGYLKIRKKLTDLMSGKRKGNIPASLARDIIDLDPVGEQKLASDLYILLSEVHDPASLPLPSADSVVALAKIAINGEVGQAADKPVAQGFLPILILAGAGVIILTITSFISNRADVQKKKLEVQCEQAGECRRTSETVLWVVGIMAGGWFAWNRMGLKQKFGGKSRSVPRARARKRRR